MIKRLSGMIKAKSEVTVTLRRCRRRRRPAPAKSEPIPELYLEGTVKSILMSHNVPPLAPHHSHLPADPSKVMSKAAEEAACRFSSTMTRLGTAAAPPDQQLQLPGLVLSLRRVQRLLRVDSTARPARAAVAVASEWFARAAWTLRILKAPLGGQRLQRCRGLAGVRARAIGRLEQTACDQHASQHHQSVAESLDPSTTGTSMSTFKEQRWQGCGSLPVLGQRRQRAEIPAGAVSIWWRRVVPGAFSDDASCCQRQGGRRSQQLLRLPMMARRNAATPTSGWPGSGNTAPKHALISGSDQGRPLYVAKANIDGEWCAGKYIPDYGKAYSPARR
uniref:DUF3421 domain-containing protein n=1 Tax=Macrostomum lignano TaxID=282301 RepID=A0A1I8FDP9_9PLAT